MVDNDDSDGDEKGQVTVVTRTMKYTMTMTINSANEKMTRMIMMMMPREKLFGNYVRPKPEWWRGRGQQGQQPRTAQQVWT